MALLGTWPSTWSYTRRRRRSLESRRKLAEAWKEGRVHTRAGAVAALGLGFGGWATVTVSLSLRVAESSRWLAAHTLTRLQGHTRVRRGACDLRVRAESSHVCRQAGRQADVIVVFLSVLPVHAVFPRAVRVQNFELGRQNRFQDAVFVVVLD